MLLCAAALVLVLDCVARRRNLVLALGLSGAAFILASAAFGDYGPSGVRFEGISGKPEPHDLRAPDDSFPFCSHCCSPAAGCR